MSISNSNSYAQKPTCKIWSTENNTAAGSVMTKSDVWDQWCIKDQIYLSHAFPKPIADLKQEWSYLIYCYEGGGGGYSNRLPWMCHVDVSQYIATTTKIWVKKEYYEISSSKLNNLCAFKTKAIPMDNLSAISSIRFFHVFGVFFTVSIAHFINDTSILRATWMSVCHLINIVNKYWWKFIPIKPNWYITRSADYKDINIYVYSVSLTIKIFVEQAIPFKRDKESVVESVVETGQGFTDGH